LRAGAVSVYGEEIVEKDYGQLLPIAGERILCAEDGLMINLAGRILVCLDTPGHAKHHITIWDQMSHGAFTGDTFGLSYREFDTEKGPFILPTTTPIHFDPKALRISLKRIMGLKLECIYPTHFSKLTGVPRLYQKLTDMLTQVENLGKSLEKADHRHELLKNGLLNLYIQELRNHGCQLSDSKIEQLLSTDIELNAQGMGVWLG
jgi:glyoxylase-like metal-dependent hydrolase (beta-lactamase superfamily II)